MMGCTTLEKLIGKVESRIVNATLLAEVICKTAYSGKAEISAIGASCEVLREYLDNTWDMVADPEAR